MASPDGPHAAIPDFVPPAIRRNSRALHLLHPHARGMAEVLRALITYGEWTTVGRVPLARALAGWLDDLLELELYGPQATLRLRSGTTLAPHSKASAGEASTGQG